MDSSITGLLLLGLAMVLYTTEVIPITLTSIMLCVLSVLFNVAPASVVWSGMISETSLLIIALMVFATAFEVSGLSNKIGDFAIKYSKGNPKIAASILLLAAIILSSFMNNTTVTVIILPIMLSVCKSSNGALNHKHWLIPLACASGVGGMLTVIGSPPQLIVQEMLSYHNLEGFGFFEFARVGIIITIMFLGYFYFGSRRISRKLWGEEAKSTVSLENKEYDLSLDRNQKLIIILFGIVIFGLVFIDSISMALIAEIGAILLIVLKGAKLDDILQKLDYSSIIVLGCSIGFAKGLEYSATASTITNFIFDHISISNPIFYIAIIAILTSILTQFMSNTGIAAVMVPISMNIASTAGINPYSCLVAVALGSSLSFITPVATPSMTLVLKPGGYHFSDFIRWSLPFCGISLIILILLIPVFWPL